MSEGQGREGAGVGGAAPQALRAPPFLAPGDAIAVVAPSSPFPAGDLWRGLAWLRGRYRIVASARIFERRGFLAGDDAARADELGRAMTHPGVKAVVAARGGYGATRILHRLPWDAWEDDPKWLVGFSDVTCLHAMAWARGVASVHGPNVTGLGREGTPRLRHAWIEALEGAAAGRRWGPLKCVHGATMSAVEGVLVGGNLTLLASLAAAGALHLPPGAVLALEDVTERPYRLDRMLTALLEGGHLASVAAVVLGDFFACDAGADGVTAGEVLAERTARLGVPVLAGAPFGHGPTNDAFPLGVPVRVDPAAGHVTWRAGPEPLQLRGK